MPSVRVLTLPGLLLALVAGQAGRPLSASAAEEAYGRFQFEEDYRNHWAFVPVVRPKLPKAAEPAWAERPIDAFIFARLSKKGLKPAPPADRLTLLRRLHLDLTGLLPSPEEQATFLADVAPGAVDRVVDGLLARPTYGERWARHWLDVVRYAESNGYERDGAKPSVWRYRDYVIDSFNNDKPFDRFVIEHLAGDEIEGTDAEAQIATTFLRLGLWDDEPADPQVDRYDQLDDLVAATSSTFMAQTVRCARCHDHKFEQFTQRDYTRMVAVFEPLERPQDNRADLDQPIGTPEELAAFSRAGAVADAEVERLRRAHDKTEWLVCRRLAASGNFTRGGASQNVGAVLPADWKVEVIVGFLAPPVNRDVRQRELVKTHRASLKEFFQTAATEEERQRLEDLSRQAGAADAARPANLPRAYTWQEKGQTAGETRLFHRGNPRDPREVVAPGVPAILVEQAPPPPTPAAHSTGRRLQLARWLADPSNPLTPRVMVNRIWQQHFGDGLVGSENDFGLVGESPTHPELVDWLAAEFVSSGWSIKHIHRLIVLSRTYGQSAVGDPAGAKKDPQDDLLGRFPPRRLEAEAVRDCILAASGRLNSRRGGPGVYPKISEAVMASQSRPGNGWGQSSPEDAARRSIYVFVKRTLLPPELEVLNFPDTNDSCEDRTVATIAPQALTFFNGAFVHEQAGHFASRLIQEAADDPGRAVRAFQLALARPPTAEECDAVATFVAAQTEQVRIDREGAQQPPLSAAELAQRAWTAACLVLLNTNEFVYLR